MNEQKFENEKKKITRNKENQLVKDIWRFMHFKWQQLKMYWKGISSE